MMAQQKHTTSLNKTMFWWLNTRHGGRQFFILHLHPTPHASALRNDIGLHDPLWAPPPYMRKSPTWSNWNIVPLGQWPQQSRFENNHTNKVFCFFLLCLGSRVRCYRGAHWTLDRPHRWPGGCGCCRVGILIVWNIKHTECTDHQMSKQCVYMIYSQHAASPMCARLRKHVLVPTTWACLHWSLFIHTLFVGSCWCPGSFPGEHSPWHERINYLFFLLHSKGLRVSGIGERGDACEIWHLVPSHK